MSPIENETIDKKKTLVFKTKKGLRKTTSNDSYKKVEKSSNDSVSVKKSTQKKEI